MKTIIKKISGFLYCLTTGNILRLISKYFCISHTFFCIFFPWRWWKSDSFDLSEVGWGFRNGMIIYSGMLNNLSFLSLLIRAEKPKKFRKDRFLNTYLNSPDKGTVPPNRAMCVYAHTYYSVGLFFVSCARIMSKALVDTSCQSRKLFCICDHRELHSIVYRSVLNYSCHWAPNLCYHWSTKENMKRIQVVIWWPAGQGDFNIGIIERGICRFFTWAAALFTFPARHHQNEKNGCPSSSVQNVQICSKIHPRENLSSLKKYLTLRCGTKPLHLMLQSW